MGLDDSSRIVSGHVQVAAFQERSKVNGPGVRSVIWVQGCPRRCPGCFNPDFLATDGGETIPVDTLIQQILAVEDTEGVTFSGGEPLEQAAALAAIAAAVQDAGKSVVVFTGCDEEELRIGRQGPYEDLLRHVDLIVAGAYREDLPGGEHPLLSSANQSIIFLTDRYRDYDFGSPRRRTEFRIKPDGTTQRSGFPRCGD